MKIDLICLPTPNHHYENDRNWIILLWTFHQNHRFCCIFTMCRDTFSEKSLFHFKPSQVSFVLILSSLLGCLQARHAFIFPRNTTWPKKSSRLYESSILKVKKGEKRSKKGDKRRPQLEDALEPPKNHLRRRPTIPQGTLSGHFGRFCQGGGGT